MNSQTVAALFLTGGLVSWTYPTFNGFLFEAANVSAGEGRIVGAIFLVAAAHLWFMHKK
jgi:hypothetical protein